MIARLGAAALLCIALWNLTPAFVQGPSGRTGVAARQPAVLRGAAGETYETQAEPSTWSWATSLLGFGATLGLVAAVLQPLPAKAITAEQFAQLTYSQVKGSGLANRCPTVEGTGSFPVSAGKKMEAMCFEPKSIAVEVNYEGTPEFVNTRIMTRQTYTLEAITSDIGPGPTLTEKDGIDSAPTTVKLPNGEYQPFLFSVKGMKVKGNGSDFKPGLTMGGDYDVPSYRTGGFLDPKGRGMYTGYDQAVGLAAAQAVDGQTELFKETNKVFDIGKGAIEMEVNKVNADLQEVGGVFVAKQPSDTDMGSKAPKTVLIKGIFYGKVE